MSTQLSLKSTVKRSSRLNPTLKKKLGFQKLEIEFISKSKKRPRSDSKVSPDLFASQDDLTDKSQDVNRSQLDVKCAKSAVNAGNRSEDANSQNAITPSTYGSSQFADAVSQSSVASYDIRKFVNDGFDSLDFADEIRKLANEGLNSQDFAVEMKKRSNESFDSQDFADAIGKFANNSLNSEDFADLIEKFAIDGLNSQNLAEAIEKLASDSLNSQNFADEIRKPPNEDVNSQDLADEIAKYLAPSGGSQDFVAPPNIESTKAKVQTVLKPKPVRNPRKAPSTVLDGNILPETFRKSDRASKQPAAERSASREALKSRNKIEPVTPCKSNPSFVSAKNLRPISDLKRQPGASTAAKPATRKSRNTFPDFNSLLEPLKIEVISQKTKQFEVKVPFEAAKNGRPISEQTRGRKSRTSTAAKPEKRNSRNTLSDFNSLLEPLKIEVISQKTKQSEVKVPFEAAQNGRPISEQTRGRKSRTSIAAKPEKRNSRNTLSDFNSLLEPLKIEVSQKTVTKVNVPLEPVRSLQPSSETKRKTKPRTSPAAKPAQRKYRSTFPDLNSLLEPLKIEVSQKTIPSEMSVSFEPTKNLGPICEQKRGRKPSTSLAAKADRKSRNSFPDINSLLEPLRIEVVSQKTTLEMNVPPEPVESLQASSEKRKRKSRTNAAAKPAKRKLRNTFPDFNSLLEPPQTETASQKTKPQARKPERSNGEPVVIRRTRLSEKKQADVASAEMELCSLFSNCSVNSSEETSTPCALSKCEIFKPRQLSNAGTAVFVDLPLSDLCKKDTDSANTDDLSDFTDLFSTSLNVGNFSENLNIMSLLRQVTKIRKKLPHFVPPSENWYEGFEIW